MKDLPCFIRGGTRVRVLKREFENVSVQREIVCISSLKCLGLHLMLFDCGDFRDLRRRFRTGRDG